MKKQMNNKGFSLVELIVVIAIMAILAVTLAPRLSQYVEKSRVASDQEAVNTIFSAAKLANVESPLGVTKDVDLGALSTGTATLFEVSTDGKTWTLDDAYTSTDTSEQGFWDAFIAIVGDFKLKSTAVEGLSADGSTGTQINIATDANGKLTITLDYDGTGYVLADDYQISE